MPFGYEGELIKIEVDLRRGIPAVDIVGIAGVAVREARERVQAAIRNSELEFPRERVLINLSPADIKKEGTEFDLAIALAVLYAARSIDSDARVMALGELELSGAVRGIRGVLAAIALGVNRGMTAFIVPRENAAEAAAIGVSSIFYVDSLSQADAAVAECAFQEKDAEFSRIYGGQDAGSDDIDDLWRGTEEDDFSDVRGQPALLRALQIAAGGGHNLFAFGPPGCGKTLALRRFARLLPNLSARDAVTVAKIYSLAGIPPKNTLSRRPPFRAPHQSATAEGMTGGGRGVRPGEVSLAHKGALFIDEAPNFSYTALQSLRAPLEAKTVSVCRAGKTTEFPADFQLLMAANLCPCGNLGAHGKICVCSPAAIERYWKRFSAPLLDRIDIRVPVGLPEARALLSSNAPQTRSAPLRGGISAAVVAQKRRFGSFSRRNANMSADETSRFCSLDAAGAKLFIDSVNRFCLSARAAHSALKVARTIADMEQSADIRETHIAEAISLRRFGDTPWDYQC